MTTTILLGTTSMGKKHRTKRAPEAIEPLDPSMPQMSPRFCEIPPPLDYGQGVQGSCLECSADEYQVMPKASSSVTCDEELPEVQDGGPTEEFITPADNTSTRSSDAFDMGKIPSSLYLAMNCANILRYSSGFAQREHRGESDHIGQR